MRTITNRNFSYNVLAAGRAALPVEAGKIVIDEDTKFVGCNFTQAVAHTDLFDLRNGATVEFEDCNLVNVSVPDAIITGGNLAQVVRTNTGNEDRPEVNLLHDCDSCAAAWAELREVLHENRDGDRGQVIKDARGRIRHDVAKGLFRARKQVPATAAADRAALQTSNAAALARWSV